MRAKAQITRKRLQLLKLLLLDWWCFSTHARSAQGDGYALCACGREWRSLLVLSRSWQRDMDELSAEASASE